jgi:hypothetical protein
MTTGTRSGAAAQGDQARRMGDGSWASARELLPGAARGQRMGSLNWHLVAGGCGQVHLGLRRQADRRLERQVRDAVVRAHLNRQQSSKNRNSHGPPSLPPMVQVSVCSS